MLRPFLLTQSSRGFTLIEMIAVIVVLSILATMGGTFVVESTKSYQSTQTRSRLINTGRQALERMSRQVRAALPNSVRLTNTNMCLEFMPIASGGNYTGDVPDALNGANPKSSLLVSPHVIDFGSAFFVSIGAIAPTELYGAGAISRATLTSDSINAINFSAMRWARNSVSKRFYLLNKPQAFCVVNNQLRFYSDLDVNATGVDTSLASSLLADNIAGTTTPFALTAGSENRNTIVQFTITFAQNSALATGAQSITLNHSVMIRNVP